MTYKFVTTEDIEKCNQWGLLEMCKILLEECNAYREVAVSQIHSHSTGHDLTGAIEFRISVPENRYKIVDSEAAELMEGK